MPGSGGASDLRGGIDKLLAQLVHGFALGAQAHHAYVLANRRADRLKVLVFDGVGLWLCTRGACKAAASSGRTKIRARWLSAASSSTGSSRACRDSA